MTQAISPLSLVKPTPRKANLVIASCPVQWWQPPGRGHDKGLLKFCCFGCEARDCTMIDSSESLYHWKLWLCMYIADRVIFHTSASELVQSFGKLGLIWHSYWLMYLCMNLAVVTCKCLARSFSYKCENLGQPLQSTELDMSTCIN